MKKERMKGFICGLLVLALTLGLGGTAFAIVGQRTATLDYTDIKITLDGERLTPTDANGKAVEPFAISGTTYLPVRAVASALGLGVNWDQATKTVVLTSQTTGQTATVTNTGNRLLNPGEVFQAKTYISFAGVDISYDGEKFAVTNNNDHIIRISASIVGVKADGTYEVLQMPSFTGVDEKKYAKDLAENGWAVKQDTNMVRPGETLKATMSVVDLSSVFPDSPAADVDGDGYYDVVFTVRPQVDADSIRTSTSDPVSDVYKVIAD